MCVSDSFPPFLKTCAFLLKFCIGLRGNRVADVGLFFSSEKILFLPCHSLPRRVFPRFPFSSSPGENAKEIKINNSLRLPRRGERRRTAAAAAAAAAKKKERTLCSFFRTRGSACLVFLDGGSGLIEVTHTAIPPEFFLRTAICRCPNKTCPQCERPGVILAAIHMAART